MNEELITLIVPIYNVDKYLKRCIDSILCQSYENIEVILVNDGSSDCCGLICEEYKNNDNRIKVIHKENGGLSDARNVALDIAKGRYITFIDSDDFISKDYISYLLELLLNNNSDISVCNFQEVYGSCINIKNEVSFTKSYNSEDAIETMLYQNNFDHSAWGKLYKKELFKNIRFPKGRIYEDLAIIYNVFDKAKKITYGSEKKYFYYIREDSITNKEFNIKKLDLIYFSKKMVKFIDENYKSLYKASIRRDTISNFQVLQQILNNDEFKEIRQKIKKNIKCNACIVLFDNKAKFQEKISIIAIFFGERFYGGVWRLYKSLLRGVNLWKK
ncbi:glycosyltransferase [Clostridium perfringens]|nr:glycosyltransferase [Clostridium perfringens]